MEILIEKDKKYLIVDENGSIIKDIIPESYILKELVNLPSNIFKNPKMYLGKEYMVKDINLNVIENYIFDGVNRDFILEYEMLNKRLNEVYIYSKDKKQRFVYYRETK